MPVLTKAEATSTLPKEMRWWRVSRWREQFELSTVLAVREPMKHSDFAAI